MAGKIERGEIRFYRFASPNKQRPVLVLTRRSATHYLSSVTVTPITSTIRGVPSEVRLDFEDGMKQPCAANLHNLVTVSKKSLGRRITMLTRKKMQDVCRAVQFALGCD